MANVLLTQLCVRSCPYCFAQKYMGEVSPKDMLSWDNLIYLADFILKSGDHHISLLGGEPLLHPHFSEFIYYLSKRGIHSSIFTSGITTDKKFEVIKKELSYKDLNYQFICNVNDPAKSPANELTKVNLFLETFGERTNLSFNIYELDFSFDFLIEYIRKYKLKNHIRLGLAHPIPNQPNHCIPPVDFPKVAERLSYFYEKYKKENIEIGFDCGFPLCIFTEKQLGEMFLWSNGRLEFKCGPAIDIGPDMSVWSCFPLSSINRRSVFEFDSMREINDFYTKKMYEMRNNEGIYESCTSCNYRKKNVCTAGCISHVINKKS
ncbi:radical SAM protein [Prevotella sp. E13-27]|uniref:radical SAM protein n=1 Tax=Prevotella sp. E13-27 TaxID=2938122 RepID=UPI00200B6145|nr:radical SAM protein [Prevotella sp. E13-27]MCK8620844.1 radical SAM protein [Prevotella sp. E13-27]